MINELANCNSQEVKPSIPPIYLHYVIQFCLSIGTYTKIPITRPFLKEFN